MKENKRNIIKLVVVLLFMIIAITIVLKVGLGDQPKNEHQPTTSEIDYTTTEDNSNDTDAINDHLIVPKTIEGNWLEGEIKIPRTLKVEEDGTITVIEPLAIASGHDIDDVNEKAEIKVEQMRDRGVEVINSYGNEDGSTILVFDELNLEKNIQYVESRFNEIVLETHCGVSINDEFNHLVLYINEETDPIRYGTDIVMMETCMIYAQIYTGTPYDEWSIQMTTVYEDTEEVMLEDVFGNGKEGSLHITDEIWLEMFQNLDKYSTESETQQGEMER